MAFRAAPVLVRLECYAHVAALRMALQPQTAVAEARLPHAFGGFVECRIDAIAMNQNGNDVRASAQSAREIVGVETPEKRTGTHRPAADTPAIHIKQIAAVDCDRDRGVTGVGRQRHCSPEQKPAVPAVLPTRCIQIGRPKSQRVYGLTRRPNEIRSLSHLHTIEMLVGVFLDDFTPLGPSIASANILADARRWWWFH